ncbi:MAG TPA: hypothetical protein VIT38_02340, partial [Allosphingosinicella sp.]
MIPPPREPPAPPAPQPVPPVAPTPPPVPVPPPPVNALAAGVRAGPPLAGLALDPAVARRQQRTAHHALGERPKPRVLAGDLNLLPAQVG